MTPSFSKTDIRQTAPLEKIGLLATIDPDGMPHITFVNSLRAAGPSTLTLGQFIRGRSKYYIQNHPRASFFILCPRLKKTWSGKMTWTGKKDSGPELEFYRAQPLQRYNSYFPIHRVHYFDLAAMAPPSSFSLVSTAAGALAAKALGAVTRPSGPCVLTPYGIKLFASPLTLKFFAYRGDDGFPVLVPQVPCTAAGGSTLVFLAHGKARALSESGKPLAVFCLKPTMESVLVRGQVSDRRGFLGMEKVSLAIDWVYNSMPPNAGQIYPPRDLGPVTEF